MRVLHVIPSVAPCRGGPSKAVVEMVCALNAQGVQSEIATTNDACDEKLELKLLEIIDYKGAPTQLFDVFSPPVHAIREFQYSQTFVVWLRKHIADYDVIHVHAIFSFCSSYAMWLARKKGIPYVVRPIGQLEKWSLEQSAVKKKFYLKVVEENNIVQANAIQFTALSERDQALDLFPRLNASIIPIGIELPEIIQDAKQKLRIKWQLESSTPVIAYLSRVHPK